MDREKLQTFIKAAGSDLDSIRRSLLIIAQTCDATDIAVPRRNLARMKAGADDNGFTAVGNLVMECDAALEILSAMENISPKTVYSVLDAVATIEAELLNIPLHSDDFLSDVAGFVDASFEDLVPQNNNAEEDVEEFEIDAETFDIFRTEADELLANIGNSLNLLRASSADQNALWEVRRNAHTFKGAAGIVGLKQASEIAHRMEDLLDKMVEMRREAVPQVVHFLSSSADRLNSIVSANNIDGETDELDQQYDQVMKWLTTGTETAQPERTKTDTAATAEKQADTTAAARIDAVKTATTPIVRVSLDRLDELLTTSRALLFNHSTLAERFAEFQFGAGDSNSLMRLESLFIVQRKLADEIQEKLLDIRMVKFGTLQTRLSRAVHVTCLDENKKALVELENGQVEVDTLIIDALIEPLLHLLKNAVVHGIESPETRRFLGKPERGVIRIGIKTDQQSLALTVSDDGSGISIPKLKEKAYKSGLVDMETAVSMDDRTAMNLIFDRGLTTAGRIDLNAGRGVGMSIVKESVEARGGKVLIQSEPQRGTKFTIIMPLAIASSEPAAMTATIESPKSPEPPKSNIPNLPPPAIPVPTPAPRPAIYKPAPPPQVEAVKTASPIAPVPPRIFESPKPPAEPARPEPINIFPKPQPNFGRVQPERKIEELNFRPRTFQPPAPKTEIPSPRIQIGEIKAPEAKTSQGPPLILIVDDSGIIRRITTKVIEDSGFRAISANNGTEALELLRSGNCSPDLILSDIEMPEMNGWEFLENLKADTNLANIPIAMVTSLNSNQHRDRAYTLGAFDFIVKPVNRQNLSDVVDRCGIKVFA